MSPSVNDGGLNDFLGPNHRGSIKGCRKGQRRAKEGSESLL